MAAETRSSKPRVLVADDHADLREAVRLTLEPAYVVLEASNGHRALELLREGGVDVAVVDIRMPVLDGIELLRMIRQEGLEVAVILVTAVNEVDTAVEAMKLGADDYIVKPYDAARLLATVERLLRPAGAGAARSAPRGEGILLVTPEPGHLVPVKLALEGQRPCRVVITPSVALHAATHSPPALVVFDDAFGVPAGRAFLCALLTNLPPTSSAIIVTAEPDAGFLLAGFELPAAWKVIHRPCPLDVLLAHVVQEPSAPGSQSPGLPRLQGHVRRAIEYIAAHYADHDVVAGAGPAIGLSSSHLARVFAAQLGVSPTHYVTRLRLEVTKCLLLETDDKLEAVAERAGFYDAAHLSRVFKHYGGETPGEYRRRRTSFGTEPNGRA